MTSPGATGPVGMGAGGRGTGSNATDDSGARAGARGADCCMVSAPPPLAPPLLPLPPPVSLPPPPPPWAWVSVIATDWSLPTDGRTLASRSTKAQARDRPEKIPALISGPPNSVPGRAFPVRLDQKERGRPRCDRTAAATRRPWRNMTTNFVLGEAERHCRRPLF